MVTITAINSITTTTPATIAPTLPSIEPLEVEVLVDDGVVEVIMELTIVSGLAVVLLASVYTLVEEVMAVEVIALASVAMVVLLVGIVVAVAVVVLTVEVIALVSVAMVVILVGIVEAVAVVVLTVEVVSMAVSLVGLIIAVAVVVLTDGISTVVNTNQLYKIIEISSYIASNTTTNYYNNIVKGCSNNSLIQNYACRYSFHTIIISKNVLLY